ncbi:DUF2635 domain-containing protein [Erwinia psidii]|uniref:DUF2635 domain-containing protein n=1 Tax=Erwinia psidii TaxID=69224 RepID=UPI00226B00C6|nr:DUF2635 domain-containing protein [Erwinia psidii]MCX8957224.1 DUF2635 domain-containing protein [Erwinia psidii]
MIKVIARKGVKVPMEDTPSRYVTDEEAVEVPDRAYWQRRLKDGDLLLYTEKAAVKPVKKNTDKSAAKAAEAEK